MSLQALQGEETRRLSLRQILGGRIFWLLLLYSVCIIAITSAIAANRHLWWDEIEVYYVARLSDFKAIWDTLLTGVDWQPPTYYLPVYYLCKWFGSSSLVLRSIAIVPYWLATLVLYITVARRTSVLHGFIAMLFPSITFAFSYAFEARPYGLLLFFTACAFLSWELTHEQPARRSALPALTLSLGAAFAVHYNACLVALPLLAGEAIRAARRRRADIPVLLAICCSAWPVIFLLPHVLKLKHYSGTPSSASILGRLSLAYETLFSYPILIFFGACAALPIWFGMTRKDGDNNRISPVDFDPVTVAASGMFFAIPIVFCGISYFSHTYYPRYVLETVIGASIFLAISANGINRAAPQVGRVLLTVITIVMLYITASRLHRPDESDWGTFAMYSDLFNESNNMLCGTTEPIVLGQGPYLIALRYGSEDLRRRAFHLIKNTVSDTNPVAGYDRTFFRGLEPALPSPSHLADYDEFKSQYRRFFLYSPDDWILQQLVADGADVKVQAKLTNGPLYSVVVK